VYHVPLHRVIHRGETHRQRGFESCPCRTGETRQWGAGNTLDRRSPTSQVKHPNCTRIWTVAKPELGTKRLCAHCSAKFYDLNKDPIVCPKCSTVYEVAPVVTRGRPEPAPVVVARAAAPPVEPEVAAPEPAEAEFVSLEEADAEATGAKKPAETPETEVEEEEVEIDEPIDDATFIEEQEEEDADVTDIIGGDIENEEGE
jgi:uncharacterized protein (TIGR02300 family)